MQTGNKPAVAAYVDSNGATKYAAGVKAAVTDGATVIYCKKDADMKISATGIKISYKGAGTRTDRIEDCTFTKCGCTAEMAGSGSTAYLADDSAAYKYKNSGTGTISLTTKGNTITGTIGDKGDTQIVGNVTLTNE